MIFVCCPFLFCFPFATCCRYLLLLSHECPAAAAAECKRVCRCVLVQQPTDFIRGHAPVGVRAQQRTRAKDLRGAQLHLAHRTEVMLQHTVQDMGGQARAVVVPDAAAKDIVGIVAQGRTKQRSHPWHGKDISYIEGLRCTSLSEAIRGSPLIQQLPSQYPAQAGEQGQMKYMLHRLHDVVLLHVHQHLAVQRTACDDDTHACVPVCCGGVK